MLRRLTLRNFKRFGANLVEFQFAPITLIFGPNSAGKSGIFQSLLALRQSWTRPHRFVRFNTCGADVDLGAFGGVVHRQPEGASGGTIEIGLEVRDWEVASENSRKVYFAYSGLRHDMNGGLRCVGLGESALDGIEHAEFTIAEQSSRDVVLSCRIDPMSHGQRRGEVHRIFHAIVEEVGLPAGSVGGVLRITIEPDILKTEFDIERTPHTERSDEDSLHGVRERQPWESPPWTQRFPESPESAWRDRESELIDHLKRAAYGLLRRHLFGARLQLQRIGHIGRLRLPTGLLAQRPTRLIDDLRVGGDAENLGPILLDREDIRTYLNDVLGGIAYPMGGSASFPHYALHARAFSEQLGAAGEVWLEHYARSGDVIARVPIDGVGTGVGQVLPVVTEWIRMRLAAAREGGGSVAGQHAPSSLLIVEQPELHLHPAQQATLMTVLAGIDPGTLRRWEGAAKDPPASEKEQRWRALGPCQLLLETHSEHMILRLKNHVRRGDIPPEDVSILVLDSYDDGSAFVEQIGLNARGEFTRPWPNGFFPERLRRLDSQESS